VFGRRVEYRLVGMEAQLDEGGGRVLLGDDRERSAVAAIDHDPVCWSLELNCLCTFRDLLYSFPT
jgi:hypothetical protein